NGKFNYLVPFAAGNMWLKKFVNSEIPLEKEEVFFDEARRAYKKIILISLQPVFFLTDLFRACIEKAPKDYLFLIRFHPNMSQQKREEIKAALKNHANIETEVSSRVNLYWLFQNCDYQLTHSSTTAMEALTFSLPTIVCSKFGHGFYRDQIKDRVILFSEDADEILSMISKGVMPDKEKAGYYRIKSDENEAVEILKQIMQEPCAA
ncbi:MAG: hypothetical protein ACXVEB_14955, partial [Bacteroidia bacterium]